MDMSAAYEMNANGRTLIMQVCRNGHVSTWDYQKRDDQRRAYCETCGELTSIACAECNKTIFVPKNGKVPLNCSHCGKPFPWREKLLAVASQRMSAKVIKSNKVFVVHGHDEEMKQAVARTIQRLDLEPVILHEQPNLGRTIIEKFEGESDVSYSIVLLSPDDIGYSAAAGAKSAKPRARQNVVAEMFYFIGVLGRKHVFPLVRGDIEIPSDYSGIVYNPYDGADGKWRFDLVKELQAVNFEVSADKLLGGQSKGTA